MFEFFYDIFAIVSDKEIVWYVSITMAVFFLFGLFNGIPKHHVPGIIVSLGIFGTFWGIFIALHPLKFEAGTMNKDIEYLLGGMKAAFLTSLLGLGGGILARVIFLVQEKLTRPENRNSPGPNDIIRRLDSIKKAIAGDDDSSMVGQIRVLRSENRDSFNKLAENIEGLAETIKDTIRDSLVQNIEELIKTIRETIVDELGGKLEDLVRKIERAFIEQFGDNFEKFNEAVQALKKWQEEHKEQVERLTNAFDETAKGIGQIKADCEAIPDAMKMLQEVVTLAREHIEDLDKRLEAFADMKEKAEQSFPKIKENLDQIGEDLKESAKGFAGLHVFIEDVYRKSTENVEEHSRSIDAIIKNMQKEVDKSRKELNSIVSEAIEEFGKQMNSEMGRVTQQWGDNMVGIAKQCADTIKKVDNKSQSRKTK